MDLIPAPALPLVRVVLDVVRPRFCQRLRNWAPNSSPLKLSTLWNEEIFANTAPLIDSGRLLQVKIGVERSPEPTFRTAAELQAAGDVEWWWHDVIIDSPLERHLVPDSIVHPTNMDWGFWAFGRSNYKRLQFRHKVMAARNRYTITFVKPCFPAGLIRDAFACALPESQGA